MLRRTLLMPIAAAVGLAFTGSAWAQDSQQGGGIGPEVHETARDQDKTDDAKGIGQEVRDQAPGAANRPADSSTAEPDGGTVPTHDQHTATGNAGIGDQAKDMAQDPARQSGIGQDVRDVAQDRPAKK